MKTAVKTPARKTNNQASFGGSLLKNNMKVETAMEMQLHLEFAPFMYVGDIWVCTMFDPSLLILH